VTLQPSPVILSLEDPTHLSTLLTRLCARLLDMGVIYVVEQKYNYHRLMFTTDLILPKNRQNPIIKLHWKILRESQVN